VCMFQFCDMVCDELNAEGPRDTLCQQWRKSVWNSGGRRADPEGLLDAGVGRVYSFQPEKPGRGQCPLPRKKDFFFIRNGVFWCILSSTFCPCPCQKNLAFSARSGDLVDVDSKDVVL